VVKTVVVVMVVVRKHEVEAIAEVALTVVVPDFRIRHKFKIDAVAVSCEVIFFHHNPGAFPQMNPIATVLFFLDDTLYIVTTNTRIIGV